MGKSCCAVGCTNRYSKGSPVHFYRFPDDSRRRAMWMTAVNRKEWVPNEHLWLCSEHFVSGEKSNDPLSPDYAPTIFQYVSSPLKRKKAKDLSRYERLSATKKRKDAESDKRAGADALLILSEEGNGMLYCEPHTGRHCSTQLTMAEIDEMEALCMVLKQENDTLRKRTEFLEAEIRRIAVEGAETKSELEKKTKECSELTDTNEKLRDTIKHQSMDDQSLQGDDARVKYYTGVPCFATLMAIFNFISVHVQDGKTALSNFQQFLLVLMKLRLNLGDQDLAYRFNISQPTVSRYFNKWIDILYVRLKPLIKWPNRDELIKTMPMDFRANFQKCVVIIDCFEIFYREAN